MTTNARRLDRLQSVTTRGKSQSFLRDGLRLSVLTTEESGLDATEPWIASCDTHGYMVACSTKAMAKLSLTSANRVEWCNGCRQHAQTGDET